MSTWIKETRGGIYLMDGRYWISRIGKSESSSDPNEQVATITKMRRWFSRPDAPNRMTVSPDSHEPPKKPEETLQSVNEDGLALIKHFEGCRLEAYQDLVGVWTIGYGHTSSAGEPEVKPGMTITQEEAETILKRDLEQYEGWVREYVRVEINDDQFSALVSFCYNLGPQSLKTSTLLEKLNAGNFQGAADEFGQWVFAGDPDQPVPGLVRRRDAERALFLSQDCYQYM